MESENRIEIAKKIIATEFTFLKRIGYQSSFKIEQTETFIEDMTAEYHSSEKKRHISINYTKGKIYQDIKHTFSASISRIPYKEVEDFFSLSCYLDSINENFDTSMVNYFDESEAEVIVKKLVGALKHYASDIIAGTEWLDDYWPRW